MRTLLVFLMVAVALPFLPLVRNTIRSAGNFTRYSLFKPGVPPASLQKTVLISSRANPIESADMAAAAASVPPMGAPPKSVSSAQEEALPKLSMADFRVFNKHAQMMEYYVSTASNINLLREDTFRQDFAYSKKHNHFRQTWQTLYAACETNSRPKSMPLSTFMNLGLQFVSRLTLHHDIEETHIFPILAQRMPEFSHDPAAPSPTARLMVEQHKIIHAGLVRLEKYLKDCRRGVLDFRLQGEGSLKEIMDSFGETLWLHLDAEVKLLGAENMRKHWKKEEIERMNF